MNAQVKSEQWPVEAVPVMTGPKVYAAIAKVMGEIGKAGIGKDRKNEQQGYKFRGIDDVYNALNGFLSAAGLCILPHVLNRSVTERATKSGGVLFYVVLDVVFDVVCATDGSKHSIQVPGEAMDSGDKATNKAMSAAYKYACMQMFCIPTEGNPDADAETHDVAPKAEGHDPRGDLGKEVADDRAMAEATAMRGLLEEDREEKIKSLRILDRHDLLNKDPDLYVAASGQLSASEKRAWKVFVSLAKAAQKEDAASSPNGRRF